MQQAKQRVLPEGNFNPVDLLAAVGLVGTTYGSAFLPCHLRWLPILPPESVGVTMREGDETFDWSALVPHVIHPLKVAIVEALLWLEEPLSASDLRKLFDEEFSLSLISYHLLQLAEADALEVTWRRQVRGAMEKFYFFPVRE